VPRLLSYLLRRIGLAVVTLAGVVVFVFLLTHILPSNPAALRAGPLADAALIQKYEREMGLDQPIYVQFFRYAQEFLSGNLGESWKTGQPVRQELGTGFLPPWSLLPRRS